MKIRFRGVNGQLLIEVVLALGVITLVIFGLVRVTITSINNASFARDQRAATKYAQEGIENARKLKEENEGVFWSKSGTGIETIGKFKRETTWTEIEDNQKMEVKVRVWWQDSKGVHESNLKTYLTKWK